MQDSIAIFYYKSSFVNPYFTCLWATIAIDNGVDNLCKRIKNSLNKGNSFPYFPFRIYLISDLTWCVLGENSRSYTQFSASKRTCPLSIVSPNDHLTEKSSFCLFQVLQREIEERGKEINSLVRCCQSTTDGATAAQHPSRLSRYARHLERSWHHIWIRSLENQCLTEQHLLRQTTFRVSF